MREKLAKPSADIAKVLEDLGLLVASGLEADRDNPSVAASGRASSRLDRKEELCGAFPATGSADAASSGSDVFFPTAPQSIKAIGIGEGEIETIILKLLAIRSTATGREISRDIGLRFPVTETVLHSLKTRRLVALKDASTANDYVYQLTELGLKNSCVLKQLCSYCGAVPVPLSQYAASVTAQSLQRIQPQVEDLRRSLAELTLGEEMFSRLIRAVVSGRGLFLYGQPGNGKTSIAERICAAYGTSIWVPRTISVCGEIVRVYDPNCHQPVAPVLEERLLQQDETDCRWVRIRRPTIVVGGEFTLDSLEIKLDVKSGICEAPLQIKSNCGVLVIDDFGRQRVSPAELLNRWIVPLEKRVDYLTLPSGRKISVPFDQFPVFATNLQPKDLVDEAFLRRIPYKINVENPTHEEFQQLFQQSCQQAGVVYHEESLNYLLTNHYEKCSRELRYCHARDLVQQVAIYCKAIRKPLVMSVAALDAAARDYFSMV